MKCSAFYPPANLIARNHASGDDSMLAARLHRNLPEPSFGFCKCLTRSTVILVLAALAAGWLTFNALGGVGDLDPAFGSGGKVTASFGSGDDYAHAVAVQSDGKIVVVGYAASGGGKNDFALARYNADGSLDTNFGPNANGKVTTDFGGNNDSAVAVALQPDGKILVAGSSLPGGTLVAVRYQANGTLDTSFGTGGKASASFGGGAESASAMLLQPDGKVVVVGLSNAGSCCFSSVLARFNADGSVDTTFGTNGKATTDLSSNDDGPSAAVLQADGKIVLAGYTSGASGGGGDSQFALVRYLANGSLDASFGSGGKVITDVNATDNAFAVAVQPDGKLVAAGRANGSSNSDFALARYNTDGSLDTSFGTGGKVTTDVGGSGDQVHALVVQSDGKIVAAGHNSSDVVLARYNADGSLDTTFGSGGKLTSDFGGTDQSFAAALQADGKIVVGGHSNAAGNYDFALARYITGDSAPAQLPPTIFSVNPTKGEVGATVTITGSNFSATPANNIVRFGAVKATVTAATATQLTVTVPAGATVGPISVTATSGLSAFSTSSFVPTFSSSGVIDLSAFAAKVDLASSVLPSGSVIADFDDDGKPDLAIGNRQSGTISVFRNVSANGTITASSFAAQAEFSIGGVPSLISAADLDGDGKLDLVSVNGTSNTASVVRNTSTGGNISFAPYVDFATGNYAIRVAISDLDGDGKPDLAVSNLSGNSISVLRNTSMMGQITSSSFAAKVDIPTGRSPHGMFAGDLDGDGKAELVVVNQDDNTVSVFRNKSASGVLDINSFAARVNFPTGAGPISVSAGDLDGDGKPDLVVLNGGTNRVSILRNTASSGVINPSSFAAKVDFATESDPYSVALGDLNGDGKLDLIEGSRGTVSVAQNISTSGSISTGSFRAKEDFRVGTSLAASGDLDADGRPELLVVNLENGIVSVLHNIIPPPPPTITSLSPTSADVGATVTITGANFDVTPANNIVYFGAGKAKVTAATATQLIVTVPTGATCGPISVTTPGGLTSFSRSFFVPTFPSNGTLELSSFTKAELPVGVKPWDFSVGDLDGDSKPDLAVINEFSNTISIYRNISSPGILGSNSFAPRFDLSTSSAPEVVSLADLDGDGNLDIVAVSYTANTVSVYRNLFASSSLNSASFASPVSFGTGGSGANYLAVVDVDGDGKRDLAVGHWDGGVGFRRNLGTAGTVSFAGVVTIATAVHQAGIALGDLDGDGKPDLVVGNHDHTTVSVFRNISVPGALDSGSFVPGVGFATGSNPGPMAIGDLDLDGKPDVVVGSGLADGATAGVTVLRNTSDVGSITSGSFTPEFDLAGGGGHVRLAIGDLNGDGKPEVTAVDRRNGTVLVWKNLTVPGSLSISSFGSALNFASGSSVQRVLVADLDLDGRPDLATLNNLADTVSLFRNAIPSALLFTTTQGTGAVNKSPHKPFYRTGETVTLTATPGRYYTFLNWSDGVIANPRTITIGANNDYTAIFTCTTPLEIAFAKVWEGTFGGTGDDYLSDVLPLPDGGFLLSGLTNSDVSGNKADGGFGFNDYWIVRADARGDKVWERVFGGNGGDSFPRVQLTADGGFLLNGSSDSLSGGNITSPSHGKSDAWLVRLDANGNKLWDRSYGGTDEETSSSAKMLPNGGIIFCGLTTSGIGGSKTSARYGREDFWVVRLDANGIQLWDKSFGGSGDEEPLEIEVTSDGGFVVGGWSDSAQSGTKSSSSFGGRDFWVLKLDANGNQIWDRSYGGSGPEELRSMVATTDGGFVLGGFSASAASGNKTKPLFGGNNGDFWVVRIDASGQKLWDTSLGSIGSDVAEGLAIAPNGDILVGGSSDSAPGGNKTGQNFGGYDGWIVGLAANGNKRWEQVLGGSSFDYLPSIVALPDGRLLLGASSSSPVSGNKSSTLYGKADYWFIIAKVLEIPVGTPLVLVNGLYNTSHVFTGTSAAQVTLQSSFSGGTIYYTLDGSTPNNSSTRYAGPFTLSQSATVRAIAYSSNNAQSALADPVTISGVAGPPVITGQPQSQTVHTGGSVTLLITATGTPPLNYQWRKDGANLAGATSATLTLNDVTKSDAGAYSVVVSNSAGSVTSADARLEVNAPPTISITSPVNGVTLFLGSPILVSASASDSDGTVTRVEIVATASATTNLVGTVAGPTPGGIYGLSWTNAPAGDVILTARAFDNAGASAASSPVRVTVLSIQQPTFRFEQGSYVVNESAGDVEIKVFKDGSGFASVEVIAEPGTAIEIDGDSGDYLLGARARTLRFEGSDTMKMIRVGIVDDALVEGDETFKVSLRNASLGAVLGVPNTTTVVVKDSDDESVNQSLLSIRFPDPALTNRGSLKITLEPNGIGRWRFPWELAWRASGTIANVLAGEYEIEFEPAAGYVQPANAAITVIAGDGPPQSLPAQRYVTSAIPRLGSLTVYLAPPDLWLEGRWQTDGDNTWRTNAETIKLPPGTHLIKFKPVSNRLTPLTSAVTVTADQGITLSGGYTKPDAAPDDLRPLKNFRDIETATKTTPPRPYAFNGQIVTDSGLGSGVVVKPNVVLTAAHLAFDGTTFSYVPRVRWQFQRHSGEFDPKPQLPRGQFILEGYAAQRERDSATGVPLGASTYLAYDRDAAALYFLEPAGRNGYAGYLSSDANPNEWLLNRDKDKLLVGYPVVPSATGGDPITGRMFFIDPDPTVAYTPVSASSRVYVFEGFRSLPGNSGGPLCVLQGRTNFFPAGIYLGVSANNSLVRAIDSDVVKLINQAASAAAASQVGTNQNFGVPIAAQANAALKTRDGAVIQEFKRFVTVKLGPAKAISAGAAWAIPGPLNNFTSAPETTVRLTAGTNYPFRFQPAAGFREPTVKSVEVGSESTAAILVELNYAPETPIVFYLTNLTVNGGVRFFLVGPDGNYQIESRAGFEPGSLWKILPGVTVTNGRLPISGLQLTNVPSQFFRARRVE
ncbi:MAG: VCBS repeat-containing protein [Verrucomicrobia bacterium]|nr:VCBS repeat-containing protein [Verrucomicrobiota bacterium]